CSLAVRFRKELVSSTRARRPDPDSRPDRYRSHRNLLTPTFPKAARAASRTRALARDQLRCRASPHSSSEASSSEDTREAAHSRKPHKLPAIREKRDKEAERLGLLPEAPLRFALCTLRFLHTSPGCKAMQMSAEFARESPGGRGEQEWRCMRTW